MGRAALFAAGFLAAMCMIIAWCCLNVGRLDDELFEEDCGDWS